MNMLPATIAYSEPEVAVVDSASRVWQDLRRHPRRPTKPWKEEAKAGVDLHTHNPDATSNRVAGMLVEYESIQEKKP